jgi:translation elongation factor EF-1alpha
MTGEAEEKLIGRITHYYSHLSVGIIELTSADLNVGDVVYIKGSHTDFKQPVKSLQIEHEDVNHADKGNSVGIKVQEKVREHDQGFLR